MAMGNAPNSGYTISLEDLRKMLPKEVEKLESLFVKHDIASNEGEDCNNWCSAAKFIDPSGPDSEEEFSGRVEIDAAYLELKEAFNFATTVQGNGLALWLCYYDSSNGEPYDELPDGENNFYFLVDGVTQLTPAGERFQDVINLSGWTTYG